MSALPPTPRANIERMEHLLGPVAAACVGRDVFLVDADRTLSPDDTSRDFLRRAGGDPMVVKARFKELGYCFESFRFHAQTHVDLGSETFARLAPRVAAETQLHCGAIEFLKLARKRSLVFVVTSGIPWIWRSVLQLHGVVGVGVIGGIDPGVPFVFGRAEKGWLARTIRGRARSLIALGDSDVDTDMLLNADHAVVVVNHKRNADLIDQVRRHRSLRQIAPRGAPHVDIPILTFPEAALLNSSTAQELECR